MNKYRVKQCCVGGKWVINDSVAEYLIIEAESSEKATEKLMEILENNDDSGYGDFCPCCGDRWYTEIDDMDIVYNEWIGEIISKPPDWCYSNTLIEYLSDGNVRRFIDKKSKDGGLE